MDPESNAILHTLSSAAHADENSDQAADQVRWLSRSRALQYARKKIAPAAASVAAYVAAFANTPATSQPLISMSFTRAERLRSDREAKGSLGDMPVIRRHRGPLHCIISGGKRRQRERERLTCLRVPCPEAPEFPGRHAPASIPRAAQLR